MNNFSKPSERKQRVATQQFDPSFKGEVRAHGKIRDLFYFSAGESNVILASNRRKMDELPGSQFINIGVICGTCIVVAGKNTYISFGQYMGLHFFSDPNCGIGKGVDFGAFLNGNFFIAWFYAGIGDVNIFYALAENCFCFHHKLGNGGCEGQGVHSGFGRNEQGSFKS